MTTRPASSRQALINLDAFEQNIRLLRVDVVDLSYDAFGHGRANILQACRDIGISHFTVSTADEASQISNIEPAVEINVAPIDTLSAIAMYGLDPAEHAGLKPVMSLNAEVLAVKSIEAGGGVSYGYTWRAPMDGWLGLVALGYADGFNRAWGNRVTAHAGHHRFPAVGRVAMDAHSISTGDVRLEAGEFVSYFGHTDNGYVYAAELAATVGCSPLAVPSNLNWRVVREVV